uniref:Aminotransferase class V domain-containing protein n=1 Tax=Hyaloperonospora arabidopsidis (strain Emoy2) TaxID=559515 RepID=M4B796_HYAAE
MATPPTASSRFFCDELEDDVAPPSIPNHPLHLKNSTSQQQEEPSPLAQQTVDLIARNVVGRRTLFSTPFGTRALCYADFTASNKPLQCVEDYLLREVMPLYGNTHTTTSITGLQSTCFRHEARQIIAQAVNAKTTGRGAEDCVLFTGYGSTSAVVKLVQALGLERGRTPPADVVDVADDRSVVFVGPFEHHSNLLPWRESAVDIVTISETGQGLVDLQVLEQQLKRYAARPLKIGAFSAASNLTGVRTDVDAVTALLHQYGALACWDYATCAPYVDIDMNPVVADKSRRPFVYKDAVYFSGHKFIGGPGSPGVLIVKKRLLTNAVPTVPGGGTVFFVTENDHRYLSNRAEREEGGTPDIIGSIRLGLAMELKQRVGAKHIMMLERRHVRRTREVLGQNKYVVLLGRQDDQIEQLPVFSFLVRFGRRFLHYNFVCALLNDLFGIQTRGGCQCAGPYAARLLGLERRDVLALEHALIEKKEMLRPGFTRMSFPYFMNTEEVEYALAAVDFVATDGWKFLPQYKFNHKSGVWKHWTRFTKFPDRKWISHFATQLEDKTRSENLDDRVETIAAHRAANLAEVHRLASEVTEKSVSGHVVAASAAQMLEETEDEALRWFVYPSEAVEAIKKGEKPALSESIRGPFQPARYLTGELIDQWKGAPICSNVSVPVCGTTTCITVSSISTAVDCSSHPTETVEAADSRETGGKYPLRLTSGNGTVESLVATSCSSGSCATESNGACTAPTRSISTTTATVQETLTAITQKTIATKLFPTPPKKLVRWVGQAMMQWNMIQEGDRLLLGVSGGKDSLSLLHVLLHFQKRAPIRFELACATVDPQTPSFDPSSLKEYMRALGVPYYYLSENIIERAMCEMNGDSLCSYCARMKRGVLYTCCRTHGFNKLVLAQHLDDLVESFFMSAMHNGQLRTMKATYWNDQQDVEVLRPLAYVREIELKKFAYDSRLPVINENCPACFEEPKERHRVKKMLAQEESLYPDMYNSLRRALLPLMDNASYAPLEAVRARVEQAKHERKRSSSSKRPKNSNLKVESLAVLTSSSSTEKETSEDVATSAEFSVQEQTLLHVQDNRR